MTINRKGCPSDSGTVRALVEQVSQLQEDINEINNEIDGLDSAKVSKVDLAASVETDSLTAGTASIGSVTLNSTGLVSPQGSITTFTSENGDFTQLNADGAVTHELETTALQVTGIGEITDIKADTIEASASIKVKPNGQENSTTTIEWYNDSNATKRGRITTDVVNATDRVITNTVNTNNATIKDADIEKLDVSQTLNVEDLNITGSITGLNNVDIDANSVVTPSLISDLISAGSIILSEENHLVPTPSLDNNDHYTVVLPKFTGVAVLEWKDFNGTGGNTVWTATVIGDGKDYEIHWGCALDEVNVTKVYQYDGRLYIRENANGQLYYGYYTTEQVSGPDILYNFTALDFIVDEYYKHDCTTPSGQISFGAFYVPRLIIKTNFFENIVTDELTVTSESINWNGTDVKVCDNFTTDWVKD